MILLNNELFFVSKPKESEINGYAFNFYFPKGTVGCRESHKYLYQKYNINEVSSPDRADIIVMEWPTFKIKSIKQKITTESINFVIDENLYYIDKYKNYFLQIEDIFKQYPGKAKISVNAFLSCFLSDREELTTDMFLDLHNKIQSISTQESGNVIAARIANIDILNYKNLIGCIMNAGFHSRFDSFMYSNTFFKRTKHYSNCKINCESLLSLYYKNLLTEKEVKIVEEIIDKKPEFFNFIYDIKDDWPHIDITINKNKPVLIQETKPIIANWGEF